MHPDSDADTALRDARHPLPDEAIVERVRGGETALYEVLVRRHNARVYRAVRSFIRNDADIEEIMQDAYVSAYEHLRQFDAQARFSTWLTKIAVNAAISRLRRQGKLTLVAETPDNQEESAEMAAFMPPSSSPEHAAASRELIALLEQSVDALEDPYRSVFVLRDVNEMTTAEAADVLGITTDAVKTRLHRARALLRRELFSRVGSLSGEVFSFHASRCDRVVAAVLARLRSAAH